MTEFIKQNKHPLNQASLLQLDELGAKLDEQAIYSLQLAQAALGLRQSGLLEQDRADVEAMVDQLLSEPAEQAMLYLTTNAAGEQVNYNLMAQHSQSPEKLGQLLLHSINLRIKAAS